MKDYNAKFVEELGFKAHQKGFFTEWQSMTSSIYESEGVNYDIAAEKAYNLIKLNGSK
jgi:hypothetical protein